MRLLKAIILFLIIFTSCKEDDKEPVVEGEIEINSANFIDDLLFVDSNNFQIETNQNQSVTFSSTDPFIKISSAGVIQRLTSAEIVAIDIVSNNNPSNKKTIYALGVKDDNYDHSNVDYNGPPATEAYDSYLQGWKTLQKLPVENETYALILRHADADQGEDYNLFNSLDNAPANWWKSCDSTLARQLSTYGKERAVELGNILRDLNYPITRVYSSEFCRAKETASLINAGPTIINDGRLNHPDYNTNDFGLFEGLIRVMKGQPVDNKMTLLSSHHPINETGDSETDTFPKVIPFAWTGGYFVKVDAERDLSFAGAVSYPMFKYWRDKKLNKLPAGNN